MILKLEIHTRLSREVYMNKLGNGKRLLDMRILEILSWIQDGVDVETFLNIFMVISKAVVINQTSLLNDIF